MRFSLGGRQAEAFGLTSVCALAVLMRVAAAVLWPNVIHYDETFQYLEQTYRLTTGRGLAPWEYLVGARSWILPGLFAPVMQVGLWLSPEPRVYLACVTAVMILLSVIGVAAAFQLALRAGGLLHAVCAGVVSACWCELVYFSPHVLSDTVSAVLLIAAIALSYPRSSGAAWRFLLAGLLFGFTFVFRMQLAPAVGVCMVYICGTQWRARYAPMAAGFVVALLVLGGVDWVSWGAPYRSLYVYFLTNESGVADSFGRSRIWFYAVQEVRAWGVFTPIIALTALVGARRLPLLALAGAVIVLVFSAVGHKEYRFIYPALPLLFTLCGVGTADLVLWLAALRQAWVRQQGLSPRPLLEPLSKPRNALALALLVWLAGSALAGASPLMRQRWVQQAALLGALEQVNEDPSACGIGLNAVDWYETGLVRLRRDIQLYNVQKQPAGAADAYNYILSKAPQAGAPAAEDRFRPLDCVNGDEHICIFRRPGGCDDRRAVRLQAEIPKGAGPVLMRLGLLKTPPA